jgi:hypothetical protein
MLSFICSVNVNLWIDVNQCIVEASQFCIYGQARLEVMGKKAKNATYISGNEPGRISREVSKVEKRRTVKSTLCNERSSRSHCVVCCIQPPALSASIFKKIKLFHTMLCICRLSWMSQLWEEG